MANLNKIARERIEQQTRTVTLTFDDGETMDVTLRPAGISTKSQATLTRAQGLIDAGDEAAAIQMAELVPTILAELVVSWDLVDDDGPIEPTAQRLAQVPVDALTFLLEQVMEAVSEVPK